MYAAFPLQSFALATIATLYASFDLFNKKNVPDAFAYSGLAVGLGIALVYNLGMLTTSLAIAAVVGVLGYAVYRLGLWGAGDFFELVTISLILPLQPPPVFGNVAQLGLPFVLSVFVAAGLAAILVVPIYYLFFTKGDGRKRAPRLDRVLYALTVLVLYIVLLLVTNYLYGFSAVRVLVVFLLALPSVVAIVFRDEIASRMVSMLYPRQLENGDMIALSMMSSGERRFFSRRYRGFGGLVTKEMLKSLRGVKRKLPVYRNAVPLAFFILIGVAVSLLFGNLLLLVV